MTPAERDRHRRVTWPVVAVYVELLAAFFARFGRDPSELETDELIDIARELLAADVGSRMVH